MNRKLFANLAVADMQKSIAFFKSLGFKFNPQFSTPESGRMIISPENFAMLLSHDHFKMFSPKPIADASKSVEVLLTLSCDSRTEVDDLVKKAVAAGGTTHDGPTDHGGMMYSHGFIDLDGHCWGLIWVDPKIVQPLPAD